MNTTYTLHDMVTWYLNKEGSKSAKNSNSICYEFLNDKFYGEDIFLRSIRGENYEERVDTMIEEIISHIEGKFNIDAININENPSIGLMVAIAVTSTKYPEEEPMEDGLCSQHGKLCYVYNFSCPMFSELGDCFFKRLSSKENYEIIRVG